jgi:hypothetical protein
MVCSIGILVLSTALFFFYVQTLCEKILRREFNRAYFQDVLNALDLEFPRLRKAILENAGVSRGQVQLALKSDYLTLTYLMKNGNPKRSSFSGHDKLLITYFRVLLLILPIHYAFHFGERQAVVKLTAILYHFANLVGERVLSANGPSMAHSRQY